MGHSVRTLLFVLLALIAGTSSVLAAADAKPASGEAAYTGPIAPLVVFNRAIIIFRVPFLGASPTARAERARTFIDAALREGGPLKVEVRPNPEGQLVMIDNKLAFIVTTDDANAGLQESAEAAAQRAAHLLAQVVGETREARSTEAMLKALTWSAAATLVFALLLWPLLRSGGWLGRTLQKFAAVAVHRRPLSGTRIFEEQYLIPFALRLLVLLRWLIIALLVYEWLSFVLSRFPYTRPWGEGLNTYLLTLIQGLAKGMVDAIPGLVTAVAIFVLARFFIGFLGGFLERMARVSELEWLSPDTLPTTRRLFSIVVWLFAVVMAYPYLPGAQTEAFKGLSVLLGLMVSLGSTSVIGQALSGLILTYTRTIRPGEYVRVAEHEGTVTAMGAFTTRIRTGLGEELILPNSVITSNVTRNYSRAVKGAGYIVDTTVTIGYDTPWRQIEAMLIEAARRTPGVLADPAPRVFQTALSDFYPEYRLVAQAIPTTASSRAEVLTTLHANIQDVFNEHGVQIMSPHYMTDGAEAKVVKPEDWYRAPARKD
ncbi:mechanosensitive ion channel family protein [Sulfurisoma sediminicola]|uniref:Small-conductance mechanosensitive channel n=1 Tax=Sulfurisoma sediminicola TaxID=1381557 RepID=A0A497XE75_9PROT|nr:mechanosensitive ion channel family protein [Sulfurisoma sediminicola]RLJ65312.1 mechanosensitive ion channel-like protein [Sulfurisoma sediminicola]